MRTVLSWFGLAAVLVIALYVLFLRPNRGPVEPFGVEAGNMHTKLDDLADEIGRRVKGATNLEVVVARLLAEKGPEVFRSLKGTNGYMCINPDMALWTNANYEPAEVAIYDPYPLYNKLTRKTNYVGVSKEGVVYMTNIPSWTPISFPRQ